MGWFLVLRGQEKTDTHGAGVRPCLTLGGDASAITFWFYALTLVSAKISCEDE